MWCRVNRAHIVGSIEANKQADIIIMDVPNHESIPYHFGVNIVDKVLKAGRLVVDDGHLLFPPSH